MGDAANENYSTRKIPGQEFTAEDWQRQIDEIFAKVVVYYGLSSPEQMQKCLRQLTQESQNLSFGQFLVKQRLLDPKAFSELHRRQRELRFSCPGCQKHYALQDLYQAQSVRCPECGNFLTEPEELRHIALRAQKTECPAQNSEFGNYRLLEEIARGGMGIVFKARPNGMDRVVALKVMRQLDAMDEEQVRRFQREIDMAGKLRHPNIVSVYDAGKIGDMHYFTMEFIQGETLSDIIRKQSCDSKAAVRIMEKIARAVDYAHGQKIIHRDLKPANIIVDQSEEPHITDFGLARDLSRSSRLTQSGTALGTPYYMAPEQIEGKSGKVGEPADVYALGVVLYEFMTGQLPFSAPSLPQLYSRILSQDPVSPRKLRPSIAPELERIILKAMAREPAKRYGSAKALAIDLKRFRTGKKVTARGVTAIDKIWHKIRPRAILLSSVALLFALSVTFCLLWLFSGTRPHGDPLATKPQKEELPPELSRRVQEARAMFAQKMWEEAEAKTAQILAAYGGHEGILPLYPLLAESYRSTGQTAKELQTYQELYLHAGHTQYQLTAMAGMMWCCLAESRFLRARRILETAITRCRNPGGEFPYLAARVFCHAGDFAQSAPWIDKVPATEENEDVRQCVKALQPVWEYPCDATAAALVDVDGDGTKEIALTAESRMTIGTVEKGNWKNLHHVSAGDGNTFTGQVVAGELTGDRDNELVAMVSSPKGAVVVVYQKKESGFAFFHAHLLGAGGPYLMIARLDKGEREIIAVAVASYRRDTKILRYSGAGFDKIEVDETVRNTCSEATSLDVGDVDGDGEVDLAMGTSSWTLYDIRVYGYKAPGKFSLKARKKMGRVSACKILDMDQDGIPELFAAKSHTVNSEVFKGSIYGEPDGLYAFRYRPGSLEELWRKTYPAGDNPKRQFTAMCAGNVNHLGPTIALIYTEQGPGDSSREIWLVWHRRHYRCLSFSREAGILNCDLGDIDGDKDAELMVLERGKLMVYGLGR